MVRLLKVELLSKENGALGRGRTCNLLIRSQILYPVELRARQQSLLRPLAKVTDYLHEGELKFPLIEILRISAPLPKEYH